MKKSILKITLLVSIVTIGLQSCKKDEPAAPTSTFVVNREALTGNILDGTVLLESGTYKLTGALVVGSGATLKINPGVIIESQDGGAEGYIAIAQGGKIDAQGTAAAPIVFTSKTKTPGSWGGIVICGKSHTNLGATATSEVGNLPYGGTDLADNSGTLRYVIIEGSGNKISGDKEFNGLSMFGVGSGTTIDYIQVVEGSDDAFEWFGGSVNCSNLYSKNCEDDGFDWVEGWNGTLTNAYAVVSATTKTVADSKGIEADNLQSNNLAAPISNPTLKNISLVSNGAPGVAIGLHVRRGTKGNFDNVFVSGYGKAVEVSDQSTIDNANVSNSLVFTKLTIGDAGTITAAVAAKITASAGNTGAGSGATLPTWATGWSK
jgi:hypothetical protein